VEPVFETGPTGSTSTADFTKPVPESTSFSHGTGASTALSTAWDDAANATAISKQPIPTAAGGCPKSMAATAAAAHGSTAIHSRFVLFTTTVVPASTYGHLPIRSTEQSILTHFEVANILS
jgi:hypothetical protein